MVIGTVVSRRRASNHRVATSPFPEPAIPTPPESETLILPLLTSAAQILLPKSHLLSDELHQRSAGSDRGRIRTGQHAPTEQKQCARDPTENRQCARDPTDQRQHARASTNQRFFEWESRGELREEEQEGGECYGCGWE